MMIKLALPCFVFLTLALSSVSAEVSRLDVAVVQNEAYKAVIDCRTRLPVAVLFKLGADNGNEKRYGNYIADQSLLSKRPECHPDVSTHRFKTYQAAATASGAKEKYDVGHVAMANHFDDSSVKMKIVNQWTNLAPQSAELNRSGGAWYATEKITECQREHEPLLIMAGVIDLPGSHQGDVFISSFKQPTPELWWKVIYYINSNAYSAWLMPNTATSTEEQLSSGAYDVELAKLQATLLMQIPEIQTLLNSKTPKAPAEMVATSSYGQQLRCRGRETFIG
jgi:DNA/RNA endonuclease G (NUC1)